MQDGHETRDDPGKEQGTVVQQDTIDALVVCKESDDETGTGIDDAEDGEKKGGIIDGNVERHGVSRQVDVRREETYGRE